MLPSLILSALQVNQTMDVRLLSVVISNYWNVKLCSRALSIPTIKMFEVSGKLTNFTYKFSLSGPFYLSSFSLSLSSIHEDFIDCQKLFVCPWYLHAHFRLLLLQFLHFWWCIVICMKAQNEKSSAVVASNRKAMEGFFSHRD